MARLDLFAPDVRSNPYPHYAELRRSAPVSQVEPGGLWAVSRYDDVMAVLKNPAVFSSHGLRTVAEQPWVRKNPLADSIVMLDPPRHTGIRALVTHAFTTRVLPRIEPLARDVARAFATRAASGEELDICTELAQTLPAAVIANLLGLDRERLKKLHVWSQDLVSIHPATAEERRAEIVETIAELTHYLGGLFEARRRERMDDLVSDLLDAQVDGQSLSDDELMSFMFLLIVAGFETTAHQIGHSMHILAARPELLSRLRSDPASIPQFVEEVLRYEPSVHGTMRLALEDAEIGGTRLPAGSVVIALLGSANRDESRFEDPERFDMDRERRTNLAFGHGIHFCLGAALARAETRIALEEIVPRIGAVHVVGEPVWNQSLAVRGPLRSILRFDPV